MTGPPVPSPADGVAMPPAGGFDDAAAAVQTGLTAYGAGRLADAAAALDAAVRLDPGHAGAWGTYGMVLAGLGRIPPAERAFRQAVALAPHAADHHDNLGVFLRLDGRYTAALQAHDAALTIDPSHPGARFNRALAQSALGRIDAAEAGLRAIIDDHPDHLPALTALATLLNGTDRCDAALTVAIEAARRAPDDPEAQRALGEALRGVKQYGESLAPLRRALVLDPDHLPTLSHLAGSLRMMGRTAMAITVLRRGLARDPKHIAMRMQLNFCLWFSPETDAAGIAAENAAFDAIHCRPLSLAAPGFLQDRDPERRLRVGYVCDDFRTHSNAFAFGRLILDRNQDRFDAILYSQSMHENDPITARLRAAAGGWRLTAALDDAALAEQIRRDGIDILVDLAAYTGGNRLMAFARRPAPVQVAWINPTGLTAIDWLITDAVMMPPPADGVPEAGPERPARIAVGALPFAPSTDPVPPIMPGPLQRGDGPVFGCFNNILKLNEPLFAVWGRLLRAVPSARLVLKYSTLDDPVLQADLRARLARQGIPAGRVDLRGLTSRPDHLRQYGDIDVALDCFPGSGGVTTWEALWMGVPVVTLAADRPNGRASASILQAIGLDRLVTDRVDDYVARAAGLVATPADLADLRAGLRDQAMAAPILAGDAYVRAVEAAYRRMWRDWCGHGG